MTNQEKIIAALDVCAGKQACDDCITQFAHLKQRQMAYSICSQLAKQGAANRQQDNCAYCKRYKHVTSLIPGGGAVAASLEKSLVLPPSRAGINGERPWHWEGNVQAALVKWLVAQGHDIRSAVNTATKEPGVDVITVDQYGNEWWITVKGYPKSTGRTSANTQALHWFSSAMFDVVKYRTENPAISIGAAFPDGFTTYGNLSKKSNWLRAQAPLTLFWVGADGTVRQE